MTAPNDRPSPYDLVFGVESVDGQLFPPIAEEAETRGLPLDDPDRFLFLASVGHLLHAIAGVYDSPPPEAPSPHEALRQYGRVLFHAFHFWRGGKRTVEIEEARLRSLLDGPATVGEWRLRAPSPAGYLRLPPHRVWASPEPGTRPEPADGVFWTFLAPDDEPKQLHVLMPLGVRPGRPGFSVVSATGELDGDAHWAEVDARPDGRDFENTLPGGELERLYSVQTTAELLKLVSLCFWSLDPASG